MTESRLPTATVLQRVIVHRPAEVRDLYWRVPRESAPLHAGATYDLPQAGADGRLALDAATEVTFDSYFNSFFELHWDLYTRVGAVALRLTLEGGARLRVYRAVAEGETLLVHEATLRAGTHVVPMPRAGGNFRQSGRLFFDLVAADGGATLVQADWVTASRPTPVTLAAVFCTFDRVPHIAAALGAIAGDAELAAAIGAVIVVSQGRPGLLREPQLAAAAAALGSKLRVVEQGNFGGTGGFARGLLEASDMPDMTHVALLDDDILLEPESLLRMIRIFGYAKPNMCIGGTMLDSIRRYELYEAGAVVSEHNWQFQPRHCGRDLRQSSQLDALLDVPATHYNAWWMFAMPLSALAEAGMPLPCFIRGDDVEFGMRLASLGRFTLPFPGIAVWHEPFYLKMGGWHLYYETRNLLALATLHMEFSRGHVARLMAKTIVLHLLTYRYYTAGLIIRGIDDFLAGPAFLEQDPQRLHAEITLERQRNPTLSAPREIPLMAAHPAPDPRSRAGFALRMLRLLLGNALRPTGPKHRPRLLHGADLVWFRMRGLDHVAVETHWDRELPTFRRSRARFLQLGLHASRSLLRLFLGMDRQRNAWRQALPRLSSTEFWRRYLGLEQQAAPELPGVFASATTATRSRSPASADIADARRS